MATERVIIRESDLISPRAAGGEVRAFCPIHGGDHQRSLAIETSGEFTGFGTCYNCHAQVLVAEMNPEAAWRIERARAPSLARGGWASPPPPGQSPSPWVASARRVEEWQREEHALLCALQPRMQRAFSWSRRAQDYLAARGTLPAIAQAAGMGYLSAQVPDDARLLGDPTLWRCVSRVRGTDDAERSCDQLDADQRRRYISRLYRWTNRIVFPLVKWEGDGRATARGFIGRTLRLWEAGMDEDRHKAAIEAYNEQVQAENERMRREDPEAREKYALRRWCKTEPAGWWYDPSRVGACVVMVEGGFDKLALITAASLLSSHGIAVPLPADSVIALAGTAASAALLPPCVRSVVLALDLDSGGLDSWQRLRDGLSGAGKRVYPCPPPADGRGKDWSARWSWWLRNAGPRARSPVFTSLTLYRYLSSLTRRECELLGESVRPVFEAYAYAMSDLAT